MAKAHSFIVFLVSFKWVQGNDVYSASVDIASLTKTHSYVVEEMQSYLEKENSRLEILKKYLNCLKKEHEKMALDKSYALNPLNAYTLIFSLTVELRNIEYYIKSNSGAEFLQRPDDIRFPVQEDLEGAATALWRLQIVYNLSTTSLAAGKLQSTFNSGNKFVEEITSPLSVRALLEVGHVIYKLADYGTALQWFHEALKKYERRDPDDTYVHNNTYIIDYIRHAYHGMRDFRNAIAWTEKLKKLMPHRAQLNDNILFYRSELEKNAVITGATAETRELQKDNYPRLCRGEVALAEEKKRSLHCSYKSGPTPFLKLAPFKTELLHHEPDVHLFYDTISDAEIETIRQLTESQLNRSTVWLKSSQNPSPTRVSKVAWCYDVDSPVVAKISQRVADIADLNLVSAEALQVSNYGLGGHYQVHYDFFNDTNVKSDQYYTKTYGDRISTIMFYMSEVEQGGATVFTHLHLTVFPVKNAAIMWANLLPSGQPDHRTKHAACPVLRGSKWVSNKWIHERYQEFNKPCSLEYQENGYLHS